MSQISVGIYRQNIITTIMLAILPSFVKKNHLHRLAPKKLLYVHRAYPLMSINHYLYHPHLVPSQMSTTNHQLQKLLLILEPQTIFLQIIHISPPMKNTIISSKLVSEKYLQHMDMEMLFFVQLIQMIPKLLRQSKKLAGLYCWDIIF